MLRNWIFCFLFFGAGSLFAQIEGIYITGNSQKVLPEGRPNVKGIQFEDIQIPGGEQKLKSALEPFLGQTLSTANAIAVKKTIMTYYVSQNKTTVAVSFPEQKTAGGVMQVLVLTRVVKPIYKGQSWYSNEQLNRYLGINPGHEIAEDTLNNNMSWINRNPFHYSQAKFVPTDEPNVVDLEITTKTRSPIRFFGRADDTGSASTGYGRFAAGFAWGNAFWIGDLLSFEYDCSNEFKRYQSYIANYTSFLSWKHILTLMGTYATVKPFIVKSPNTHIDAVSADARVHYTIPFKPLYASLQQSIILGIEYKYTNSNIVGLPGGAPVVELIGPPVIQTENLTQLYGNYTITDSFKNNDISFSIDAYGSPMEWLPNQSNADYEQLRPNSKNRYFYTSVTFSEVYTIPKVGSVSVLLRGQVSNDTLPPTELFSLGGYNTVRGYHECEYNTDNGFIGNLEFRTPWMKWGMPVGELLFLAFFDYGIGHDWFVPKMVGVPTPPHTQYLMGVGPGFRYRINPYLQARLDYGFKLHHLFTGDSAPVRQLTLGFGQFHVGLLVSY